MGKKHIILIDFQRSLFQAAHGVKIYGRGKTSHAMHYLSTRLVTDENGAYRFEDGNATFLTDGGWFPLFGCYVDQVEFCLKKTFRQLTGHDAALTDAMEIYVRPKERWHHFDPVTAAKQEIFHIQEDSLHGG